MTLALVLLIASLARPEGAGTPAPTLALELRADSAVRGNWVTVGDIAEVSGIEGSRLEEIRAVRLGRAPMPGVERVLSRDDIAARLRQAGVSEAPMFTGTATGVRVTALVRTIPGSDLIRLGREALEKRVTRPEATVTIEDPDAARAVTVPDGDNEMRAVIGGRRLTGLVTVYVEIWSEGKRLSRVPLSYRVSVRQMIPHLVRALKPGEVISEKDIEERERELSMVPDDAILSTTELLGLTVARTVAEGNFVRRSEVSAPVVLKRGSQVILVARIGSVEARASATAREDGAAGQVVTVMNTTSKRTVKAKVLDAETVEAVMQ